MSPTDNGNGYLIVSLRKNRKRKNHYIHRLVASHFIRTPKDISTLKEIMPSIYDEFSKILSEKTDKMLSNPGFVAKAPAAKVEEEKVKQAKFNEMIKTIEERIAGLK